MMSAPLIFFAGLLTGGMLGGCIAAIFMISGSNPRPPRQREQNESSGFVPIRNKKLRGQNNAPEIVPISPDELRRVKRLGR